jgi:hypothetical protein
LPNSELQSFHSIRILSPSSFPAST